MTFALQPGEVGVAVNQPQTIVYLVGTHRRNRSL